MKSFFPGKLIFRANYIIDTTFSRKILLLFLLVKMQINGRKNFSGKTYLSFSIIINIGDLVLNDFSLEFGKEIKNRFGVLRIGDEWMLKKLIKKIDIKK